MNRIEEAKNIFSTGYNCCQTIVLANKDLYPHIDEKTLAKLSLPFGGGVAGTRNFCGALSGLTLVSGLLSEDSIQKSDMYKYTQGLLNEFTNVTNCTSCAELLKFISSEENKLKIINAINTLENTSLTYDENIRPCYLIVALTQAILNKYLTK